MTVWWGVSWSTSVTQYNAMWNSMMQYQQDNTILFEVFTVQCNTKPITIWYGKKYHMGSNSPIAWPLTSSWKVTQKGENYCLGVALVGLWTPNGPHSWKDEEMWQKKRCFGYPLLGPFLKHISSYFSNKFQNTTLAIYGSSLGSLSTWSTHFEAQNGTEK